MEGTRYFAHNHDKEIRETIIANREVIQQLQAQVERFAKEAEKIPYRCGWHEGVGMECTNKNPYKENYCPCTICPRYKALESTANAELEKETDNGI
jgi:hypothetical protein